MNQDLRDAADEHAELEIVFKDAQNDTLKQRAQAEEFVRAGVDLLIVSPKEAQPLIEPIAEAFDAGIAVIVLDREVLGDKYTVFIGADNEQIGEAAGRWIAQQLRPGAKVVELKGLMTSTPGLARHQGFRRGISGAELDVVFEADMQWLEPNARREMESALARHSDLDLVYAHNDPGAHGAFLAAKAAGREGDIRFVGIDALPHEGVAYVQQGILDATFQYPTGGREAIEPARAIVRDRQTPPKWITLGSKVFTADNTASGGETLTFSNHDDQTQTPADAR